MLVLGADDDGVGVPIRRRLEEEDRMGAIVVQRERE